MNETTIAWTQKTWNVWSGCIQISPGCARCYAKKSAENKRGTLGFPNGFDLTYRWHKLEEPLKIKKPAMIFVNSMSDLYLEDVPLESIRRVFDIMNRATWHTFQILTKRSQRLLQMADKVSWTPNIWQGVSVENQRWTSRIDDLVLIPAWIKFVSAEPLLGPVDLTPWLDRIDWVIVGGESGPKFRKMDVSWARAIRDRCLSAGVPFFYKQSNGYRSGTGPTLDGAVWRQFPKGHFRKE
jgi:protein gp37